MNTADGVDTDTAPTSPHQRRWHPLLRQWSIIATGSAARPWQGATTKAPATDTPKHDENCYLCPRVKRSSGQYNPDYTAPWAFDNDFPSLDPTPEPGNRLDVAAASADATSVEVDPAAGAKNYLAASADARGTCRVLCWHPRHDLTLADIDTDAMQQVVQLWTEEFRRLSARDDIAQVTIFENKGVETGVSNLHPHGQIYATGFVTATGSQMRESQAAYSQANSGSSLLPELLGQPEVRELIVDSNEYFITLVPFAARFAYETWIVPRTHTGTLAAMSEPQLTALALSYQRQARRYDLLFGRPAPNITLLHNAPVDAHPDNQFCCFHLAMQPPLREPDKLKFLAGFESAAGNIINPVLPELAAERLRQCDPDTHAACQQGTS